MPRPVLVAAVAGLLCAACTASGGTPADAPMTGRTGGDPGRGTVAARAVHTATTLTDGSVVVVGGCVVDGCSEATDSVQVVTAEGAVTTAPSLTQARDGHSATLLPDGSVLVAGGFAGEGQAPLASSERLAPGGSSWDRGGDLATGRGGHAAASLGDGRVLVAGGWVAPQSYTSSTEVFDAGPGGFEPGPRLPEGVDGLAASTLQDGSVLVTGGQSRPGVASAQAAVVAPDGSLTPVGPLSQPRFKHASVTLPSGEVLVIGGTDDDRHLLRTTEIFSPRSATFRPGPRLTAGRYKMTGAAVALPDGRVVVAGGGPGVEVIDPSRMTSERLGRLPPGRASFSTVSLVGGRLLVLGGYDEDIRLTRLFRLLDVGPRPG